MRLANGTFDFISICAVCCIFPSSFILFPLVIGIKTWPEDTSPGSSQKASGRTMSDHSHHEVWVHRWASLSPASEDSSRNVSLAAVTQCIYETPCWWEQFRQWEVSCFYLCSVSKSPFFSSQILLMFAFMSEFHVGFHSKMLPVCAYFGGEQSDRWKSIWQL